MMHLKDCKFSVFFRHIEKSHSEKCDLLVKCFWIIVYGTNSNSIPTLQGEG